MICKKPISAVIIAVMLALSPIISFSQITSFSDLINKPTTIQLGWHALDDDAKAYSKVFAVKNWSMLYFPTRLSFTKTIVSGLKAELALAYTKMNKSSYAPERYMSPGIFLNVDLNARYQYTFEFDFLERLNGPKASGFNKFISGLGLNVFALSGFGFSKRSQTEFANAATFNFGFGGTFWLVSSKFGITGQSTAKWGLQKPFLHAGSNYIHHSLGLVYVTEGNKMAMSSNRFKRARRPSRGRSRSRNRF